MSGVSELMIDCIDIFELGRCPVEFAGVSRLPANDGGVGRELRPMGCGKDEVGLWCGDDDGGGM